MPVLRILFAFLSIAGFGLLFGVLLSVASRFFAVQKDERIALVEAALAGLNCGACGYPGCAPYAEAIVNAGVDLTLCTPGGPAAAAKVGGIMGKTVNLSVEKKVTQVMCTGGNGKAKRAFEYSGIRDCNAAYLVYGGGKSCSYGCLGLGSCAAVCPVDAISATADGLMWVDPELCVSCGKCVPVCPTGVMQWLPASADLAVLCSSKDKGAETKRNCTVGCIGCKICEKKSPEGGFVVENWLARIDYAKAGSRGEAAEACPPKCILTPTKRPDEG